MAPTPARVASWSGLKWVVSWGGERGTLSNVYYGRGNWGNLYCGVRQVCVAPGVDLATPYVLHALEVEENGNLTCPGSRTLMALNTARGFGGREDERSAVWRP